MTSSLFNSSSYYGVNASLENAQYWLSDAYTDGGPPENLSFTQTSYSSNNWQFFYQDSVYLIRNYDYKLSYQLGVNTTSSPLLPALLPASGELTQQWNITKSDDGTFRVTNLELGTSQALGVQVVLDGPSQLVMSDAQNAEGWTIYSNPDAPAVPQSMQQSVLLQAPSTTSISSSSASVTGTTATTSTPASHSPSSTSTASKGISGGTIGGIVVGVVVAVLIVIGILFFMRRRRTRAAVHEVDSGESTESKPPHEIQSQSVHEIDSSSNAKQTSDRIAELSS